MSDYVFDVIQFRIPRAAAEAIDFPALRRRGRELGLDRTGIEYNTHRQPPNTTLITTDRLMAKLLVDALVEKVHSATGQIVLDCGMAAKAVLDAMAPPNERRANRDQG